MKRFFFKQVSLILILAMLLSLVAVAEDGVAVADSNAPVETVDVSSNETPQDNTEVIVFDEGIESGEEASLGDISDADLLSDIVLDGLTLDDEMGEELQEVTDDSLTDEVNAQSGVPATLTLGVKMTYTLNTKKLGKKVTYKSDKPKVAAVDNKGVITAKKKGEAKITCIVNKKTVATCEVTVLPAPSKVKLAYKTLNIGYKESVKLEPIIKDGTCASFTFTTKDAKVASVSDKGVVKGLKVGKSTTITVTTHNKKSFKLKVKVMKAPGNVKSLTPESAALNVGETVQLKATLPDKTASQLTWKSDNSNVATVDKNGLVIAVGAGTAKITVKTFNKKTKSCTITVNEPAPTESPTEAPTATPTTTPTAKPALKSASAEQASFTVVPEASATLKVITTCEGDPTLTYKWFREGTEIAGASEVSYTVPTDTVGTVNYKCVVSDGETSKEVAFSVTVNNNLTASAVSPTEQTIINGQTVTLEVSAGCAKGTPTYQWYKDGAAINNAMGASYTSEAISTKTTFKCEVGDAYGSAPVSVSFTVDTKEPSLVSAAAEVAAFNLKPTETATLQVNTECDGQPTLTYAWYEGTNTDPITTGVGDSYKSLSVTATTVGEKTYRCDVSDGTTSKSVSFTVNVDNALTATAVGETTQTVLIGQTATLKVEASCLTSDRLTCTWYRGNEAEPVGTGAEFTTAALDQAGEYKYRCVVSDGYGSEEKTVEFTVTASVPKLLRAYTETPEITIAPNQTATLEVKTECFGTPTLTYEWTLNDAVLSDAGNAASYVTKAEAATTVGEKTYQCTISDGTGADPAIVTFTVTVDNALTATAASETTKMVFVGQTAILTVEAGCLVGDPTYQWYTVSEDGDTAIDGATSASLTTDPIAATTTFKCVVGDGYGSVVDPVVFTVTAVDPAANGILIDKDSFPDANFRAWVLANCDDGDGVLSDEEIAAVTTMKLFTGEEGSEKGLGIQSLAGIEHFTALTNLNCTCNELTELDLRENTALATLNCSGNHDLMRIDLTGNANLTDLNCSGCGMTTLDLSGNTALKKLNLGESYLETINLSHNTSLVEFRCFQGMFTSLDFSANTKLESIYLGGGCVEGSVVFGSGLKELKTWVEGFAVDVSNCPNLEYLRLEQHAGLNSIDLTNNTALRRLEIFDTELSSLDLSHNPALKKLTCGWNKLTELDVTHNTKLTELTCPSNKLTNIDLSRNTELLHLRLEDNQLTTLDISACPSLIAMMKPENIEDEDEYVSYSVYGEDYWYQLSYDNGVQVITEAAAGDYIMSNGVIIGYRGNGGAITLPEQDDEGNDITAIGARAFADSTISAINLPSTLESIDDTALPAPGTIQVTAVPGTWAYGWAVEKGYIVPEASSLDDFVIEDGVVTEYVGAGGDVVIPSKDRDGNDVVGIGNHSFFECTNVTSVVIPNTVTYIENGLEADVFFSYEKQGAFYSCTGLKGIFIPSSITSIGDGAFRSCESLTNVTIPYGVVSIGEAVFYGCSSLTDVTIPDSVTSIGDEAFWNCGLTSVTIPNSTTSIGARAFEDCFSLTSVTIGNGVTSIGGWAFNECPVLTSISVDSANQYYSSLNGVLFNKQQSTLIAFPGGLQGEYVIPNSVTSIEEGAFGGSGLTSVTIPNSVTSIGKHAFWSCCLTSVTIPNSVTSMGENAFVFCNLTSVTIENSFIGRGAFYECHDLTNVTIGDSVTSIGVSAFYMCSSLTSVTIPNSVTSIGAGAFNLCRSLMSVMIGNGVTSIGEDAFSGCTSLTSVTIPNSVTSIGESAFEDCSSLTSVTIPNSVTSIDDDAFYGCSNLTAYVEPGSYAEQYCIKSGIKYEIIGGEEPWPASPLEDFVIENGVVTKYVGAGGDVIIPSKDRDGNDVVGIGYTAFENCSSLTSITIPNSVISIGFCSFKGCCSLSTVTIPNSVTSIGEEAFALCDSLTSVTIPNSVTSIGEGAFLSCINLTSVTIPNSVTSIGNGTFGCCKSLTSITLPNSVTSLGDSAFSDCDSLTSITLPNTVTSIGDSAFSDCDSLTSVTIPNSVTSIGFYAFYYCGSLTSITIPNSVTSFGDGAFAHCNNLTAYVVPGSYAEQYCKENAISYMYRSTGGIINDACLRLTLDHRFYKVGSDISITTTMTGGTAPYRYIYVMSIDNGVSEVSEWTDNNTHTFVASGIGKARIGVMVQDSTGAFSNPTIIEATINDTGFNIPVGAPTYDGHYYYVYEIDSIKTWEMAEIYCESKGGYLATITSQEENDFVYNNVVRAKGYESAYFGLTDHNERGVWRWVNGEKVDYLNWSYGEPNNEYGDEDYAMFYHEYTNGTWNDGCFGKRTGNQGCAFICEWGDYVRDTGVIQTARDYRNWGKQSDMIRPVEYALLCACCNKASEAGSRSQMESDFYNQLSRFPEGHPLHVDSNNPSMSNIGRDNIIAYREGSENAMEAIQIIIDSSHAIVVFAGTTSFDDGLQDALILYDSNIFNLSLDAVEASLKMFDPENVFHESQPETANRIIQQIASQGFSHLYVTGHSLGGHLAADVTLHNEEVEECMTFDPPGRGEAWFQNWFNSSRTSKIVNYLFVGSPVHMVGLHIGLTLALNVEANWNYPPLLWWHDIEKAYEKLGGNSAIIQR